MNIWLRSTAVAVGFATMALVAPHAYAGCGGLQDPGAMQPAVYRPGAGGAVVLTHFAEPGDPFGAAPITGLWTFTAEGNAGGPGDGTLVDAGFVVWHDDGTEIMNSGRAPVTGSFCLGVWRRVGESTYHLNHWALSWVPGYTPGLTQSWSLPPPLGLSPSPPGLPTPPPGSTSEDEAFQFLGPTNIQEVITLDRTGDQYSGTFRLTQYEYDGIDPTDAVTTLKVIVGTVSATRISVQ